MVSGGRDPEKLNRKLTGRRQDILRSGYDQRMEFSEPEYIGEDDDFLGFRIQAAMPFKNASNTAGNLFFCSDQLRSTLPPSVILLLPHILSPLLLLFLFFFLSLFCYFFFFIGYKDFRIIREPSLSKVNRFLSLFYDYLTSVAVKLLPLATSAAQEREREY